MSTGTNQKSRSPIFYILIFATLIISFMAFRENASLRSDVDKLESDIHILEQECEEQFEKGYIEGQHNIDYNPGEFAYYYEIQDMDTDEILKYLNDVTGERYWSNEEAYSLFIYAFQRGYTNHANNICDEMTQEFIEGYEFSQEDIDKYSIFEWD